MQLWQQSGKAAPFVIAELTQIVRVGEGAPADAGTDGPPTGFDASADKFPPDGPGGGGGGCATADARSAGDGLAALLVFALCAALRRRRP
jgi:MYXO-CTERM domain-containing protein